MLVTANLLAYYLLLAWEVFPDEGGCRTVSAHTGLEREGGSSRSLANFQPPVPNGY
jgi:hypothetical protein